jgi:hypothetical protein
VWFYGLLHEVGHVHASANEHAPAELEDRIAEAMTLAMANLGWTRETFEATARELADAGRTHAMRPEQLRVEATADTFATKLVWEATKFVLMGRDRKLVPFEMAVATLRMFDIIAMINRAATESRLFTQPWRASEEDPLKPLAITVRINAVFDVLVSLVHDALTPRRLLRRGPAGPSRPEVQAVLNDRFLQSQARRQAIEDGVRLASAHAHAVNDRLPDVASRLAARMKEARVYGFPLRRFFELADALSVSHPDIDGLKALRDSGTQPVAKDYYMLLETLRDGSGRLFGVQTSGVLLVPVFASRTGAIIHVIEKARARVAAGTSLSVVFISVRWQWDLAREVAERLPEAQRRRCRVVVEGCRTFDNAMARVFDE